MQLMIKKILELNVIILIVIVGGVIPNDAEKNALMIIKVKITF